MIFEVDHYLENTLHNLLGIKPAVLNQCSLCQKLSNSFLTCFLKWAELRCFGCCLYFGLWQKAVEHYNIGNFIIPPTQAIAGM